MQKPIQYSEEERRVVEEIERERQAAIAADAAAAQPAQPAAAQPAAPVDPKVALRTLMDSIPTVKEGVYGYAIKWSYVNDAVKERFR